MDKIIQFGEVRADHIVETTPPVATLTLRLHADGSVWPQVERYEAALAASGEGEAVGLAIEVHPHASLHINTEMIPEVIALDALRRYTEAALEIWEDEEEAAAAAEGASR
ncbi:MAG: hypothetical protein AAFV53_00305 [Myxococcota bacterium]